MRASSCRSLLAVTLALGACAAARDDRARLLALLPDAPPGTPARLSLAGDRIVAASAPIVASMLPPAVRTVFDAIAPGGTPTLLAREWNERGDGYRLETRHPELGGAVRSVFATADGDVLERWHTVPVPDVPQQVLATALRTGPTIDEARIVSGAEREEHWAFVVRDRVGRTFVVDVGLDGAPRGRRRQLTARVEL